MNMLTLLLNVVAWRGCIVLIVMWRAVWQQDAKTEMMLMARGDGPKTAPKANGQCRVMDENHSNRVFRPCANCNDHPRRRLHSL